MQELKKEANELQKQKIDKIESIKKLQGMLHSQEKEDEKYQEMVKDLKDQLKTTEEEQDWLKKEIDQVTGILQQKNQELASNQKQVKMLEENESSYLKQVESKSQELNNV